MKATNKFGIHFKIRSERVKQGKAPVFVGIAVDGDKAYMALKNGQAELIHWDTAKGLIKRLFSLRKRPPGPLASPKASESSTVNRKKL